MNEEKVKERHKAQETKKLLNSIKHDAIEVYIPSPESRTVSNGPYAFTCYVLSPMIFPGIITGNVREWASNRDLGNL